MSVRFVVLCALGYLVGSPARSAPLPIPQSLGDLKTSVTLGPAAFGDIASVGSRTVILVHTPPGGELWVSDSAGASPVLLADLCPYPLLDEFTIPAPSLVARRSADRLYFVARCLARSDLWVSDGTATGTRVLFGASAMSVFGELGSPGQVLFQSSGKVWVTDGTRTGTALLHDFGLLARFGTVPSIRLGTRRIFAVNPPDRSLELWASDGTAAGTERLSVLSSVADSVVAPSFAALGGRAIFAVARRDGQLELWQTDGHVGGTSLVRSLGSFDLSKTPILLSSSERAYLFVAETFELSRLWTSDGTASGTRTLVTLPGVGVDFVGIVLGHRLYFAEGLGLGTLWISDGTTAGTQKISDLRPSGGPFQKIPSGVLLPVRRTGVPEFQNEVWLFQEDGSRHAVTPPLEGYSTIAAFDGAGFFFEFHSSEDNSPSRLFFADGSPAGTRVVATFPRGSSLLSRGLDATGSALVAVTAPGTRDPVLQRFENRPREPDLWLDLERFRLDSSSAPRFAVTRPNRLYFTADDDQNRKGWILDPGGAARPTFPVSTTQAATATVDGLLRWGFDEERGQRLTWSDETSILVAEIFATFPPPPLSPVGTDFWFPSTEGLLRYDSGTRTVERLVELDGGSVEQTSAVVPLAGAHYFFQLRLPLTHRLWRTDGTQAGTVPIIDFQGETSRLVSTGQRLFFVRNSSRELWTSDGTSDGTRSLPLPTGLQISGRLVTVAGRVFFTPYNSALGDEELWTSDGTAEGTVRLLGNLGDLCCRQEAPELVPLDNGVVFAAAPDNAGGEPWWSDGTASGTRRIADLWPGPGSSSRGSSPFSAAGSSSALRTRSTAPSCGSRTGLSTEPRG